MQSARVCLRVRACVWVRVFSFAPIAKTKKYLSDTRQLSKTKTAEI